MAFCIVAHYGYYHYRYYLISNYCRAYSRRCSASQLRFFGRYVCAGADGP